MEGGESRGYFSPNPPKIFAACTHPPIMFHNYFSLYISYAFRRLSDSFSKFHAKNS